MTGESNYLFCNNQLADNCSVRVIIMRFSRRFVSLEREHLQTKKSVALGQYLDNEVSSYSAVHHRSLISPFLQHKTSNRWECPACKKETTAEERHRVVISDCQFLFLIAHRFQQIGTQHTKLKTKITFEEILAHEERLYLLKVIIAALYSGM